MFRLRFILYILFAFLIAIPIVAQNDTCSTLVQSALKIVDSSCNETGRNQVCYGNITLSATVTDDAPTFNFETPGDLADIIHIESLQLSVLHTPDEWGVALMKIQANLPDTTPGQSVTMLLFGDVYIENQAEILPDPLSGTITASANLRSGPSTDYRVVGAGTLNAEVVVDGRNEAGDWFRIFQSETGNLAWIFGSLIEIEGDSTSLTVVEVDDPAATGQFGSMQAFFLRTGIGDVSCQEAPPDGILIQTPEGAQTVNLSANDVRIQLGSTAFLTAVPDDFMTITLLDGQGIVTAQGRSVTVPTGLRARVPLDSDGLPSGPPELITYEAEDVRALPVQILENPFDIPEPAEIPTPPPNPSLGYAGTWNLGVTPPVNCSNGLELLGAGGGFPVTLEATSGGLSWNGRPLSKVSDSIYTLTLNQANGTIAISTFNFGNNTYSFTFNVNGVSTFGCNEIATASSAMSR